MLPKKLAPQTREIKPDFCGIENFTRKDRARKPVKVSGASNPGNPRLDRSRYFVVCLTGAKALNQLPGGWTDIEEGGVSRNQGRFGAHALVWQRFPLSFWGKPYHYQSDQVNKSNCRAGSRVTSEDPDQLPGAQRTDCSQNSAEVETQTLSRGPDPRREKLRQVKRHPAVEGRGYRSGNSGSDQKQSSESPPFAEQ